MPSLGRFLNGAAIWPALNSTGRDAVRRAKTFLQVAPCPQVRGARRRWETASPRSETLWFPRRAFKYDEPEIVGRSNRLFLNGQRIGPP
jgi:hypothetical protein